MKNREESRPTVNEKEKQRQAPEINRGKTEGKLEEKRRKQWASVASRG